MTQENATTCKPVRHLDIPRKDGSLFILLLDFQPLGLCKKCCLSHFIPGALP